MTFLTEDQVSLSYFEQDNQTILVFTVKFDDSNEVCSNKASARRKRAAVSIKQDLLISLVENV